MFIKSNSDDAFAVFVDYFFFNILEMDFSVFYLNSCQLLEFKIARFKAYYFEAKLNVLREYAFRQCYMIE